MSKFIDLTGQKFGRLTVIKRANKKGELPVKWECQCDCGNKKITTGDALRRGVTQSCGCLQKDKTHEMFFDDLSNKKFNRWTVLEYAGSKNNKTYWKCKCDCGTIRNVRADELKNGTSISCGCYHLEQSSNYFKYNNPNKFIPNKYDLSGEYGIGYTNNMDSEGRNYFYFDLEDYDKIKDYKWYFGTKDYVVAVDRDNNKNVFLHKVVCNTSNVVDHIKHNKYDNRKSELRICTNTENSFNRKMYSTNTSGHTGVYYRKDFNKFCAIIGYKGKIINLGYTDSLEDAIKLRKEAEEKYFGEFSYDNSMKIGAINNE